MENNKKEKDMLLSLVLFCCYFWFCLYEMSIQCHVIGFNFLIENYDIIDNFGSFGSFFFFMWSIFVNVISTLCYSQNKETNKKRDKKTKTNKKADGKNSQMFLLYPQYLKLQSWFSIDLVWDFSLVLFLCYFILFYCFLVYTVPVSPVVKCKWTC